MLDIVFGCARVLAFVELGRPKFLVGGFVLYGLGAALAVADGAALDWSSYALGQGVVSATQLMTHYSNDYFDLEADRANSTPTRWSGGSRILPNGQIAPRVALIAALVLAAATLVMLFLLAAREQAEPLVIPIALGMLVLSWCYSAPPLRLLSRGLGELTTALVVTLLTPLFAFYLQRAVVRPVLLLSCLPLCGLQFAMLLTIELPDAAGDAALGKRTLVVRRGAEWAGRAGAVILVASFGVLPVLVLCGLPWLIAALAALSLPLGAWHAARLMRGAFRDPACYESLALCSVLLLVAPALGELAGALILASRAVRQ
jgi:1,4-dihydroxy-2-naphthoate octaprenyltransferase